VEYVEELIRQAEKPVFALRDYKNILYYEADLKGQVGVHHDLHDEDGPIWLKIERLKRVDPPAVSELIREWVTISRDPFREPVIETPQIETMHKDDATKLVARGVIANDDIQPALKSGQPRDYVDVVMRLERFEDAKVAVEHYISGPWREWAEAEKPRRRTIAIYGAFFSLQQAMQSDPEHPNEVVWGVGLSRWKVKGTEIDHPLIEQMVELDIESRDGAIRIRPRAVEPQLALRPFFELDNDGAPRVQEFGKKFLGQAVDDRELSPFRQDTFAPILRQAATQLDTRGVYYPDQVRDITDRTLPTASENLIVSDTWAIYARQRSGNVLLGDLGRLKAAVDSCEELPGSTKRLVTEPSDARVQPTRLIDIGSPDAEGTGTDRITGGEGSEEAEDFFFPKPFNDEQIAIIKRLETADGMVVQGPPGTGKTHTIANIICHCLATGKRVLVTSKAAEPLVEVRNHIPPGIQDLVISLLSTEREGLKQLETAVRLLSNTAVQFNVDQLEREIVAGQRRVAELGGKIDKIDRELSTWAEKHLTKITLGKEKSEDGLIPAELAERVVHEQDQHAWLRDELDLDAKFDPSFTDEDIATARSARKAVGVDLAYLGRTLPSMADLPDAATLAALHQDLVSAAHLEQRIADESLPVLSMIARDAATRAEALLTLVQQTIEFFDATVDKRWLARLFEMWWRNGLDANDTRLFSELIPAMSAIADRRPDILRNAVGAPQRAHSHPEVADAVERAGRGKRPFGPIPFGRTEARALVLQIKVQGRRPESTEDWKKVAAHLAWHREISEFIGRWTAIRDEFGLPLLEDHGDGSGKWIADTSSLVSKARRILKEHWPRISSEVKELFPSGIEASAILGSKANAVAAAEAIKLNLSRIRLAGSRATRADLIKRLAVCSGAVVQQMSAFVEKDLGCPELNAQQVADRWEALCRELTRIHNLALHLAEVERVAELIERSGGTTWAQQLRTQAAIDTDDPLTPGAWRESWQWARFSGYLRRIDGRDHIRELSRLRLEYEDDRRKIFAEVVKLRTYLGLKRNLTDRVQAALVMFTQALGKLVTGKGIRAPRFRRFAREAMERCYSAVPCWIMPTWRVSEHLPAEIGSFDLVIVDEASQSSVEALPALMRGQKLLIVGDDRQVSPTAAFVEERKILLLQHNYLKEQPFAQLLLPGSSIYDLANAVFPGTRIMLREHFRCVEPIIRFSFQFYPEPIIPLRIPKPSERLDPPLIDVLLPHGRKDRRKVNRAEAEAIVAEIETLVKDPIYASRTLGVVSLIGAQQAHFIQQLLLERIGEEAFLRHKVACGDAATFQGKERDIMFVSMVDGPGDSARTSQVYQQRFNVALSRARDRMYLFRSIADDTLRNPEDLRLKVIRHFREPMLTVQQPAGDLIDRCESGFERDVYTRLADPALGYCVTPQVGVGSWRIDLVVEGNNDRRLAVELDGDKSHPPEKWLDDMLRQRAMERMGWRFWRCWASSFALDPEGCMADLVSTLTARGIEPMAREARKNIYTEHRVVETPESGKPAAESAQTETEPVVEVGDRVLVAYNDAPAIQVTLLIAADQHDPNMGIFKASDPAGAAFLEAAVDDEVIISLGDRTRLATILAIDKARTARASADAPVVRDRATTQSEFSSGEGAKPLSQLPAVPKLERPTSSVVHPAGNQPHWPPGLSRTRENRVLEELRILDKRFQVPRCSQCGYTAHLAITNEGVVIACKDCKKIEHVDRDSLQRLAERLSATCYSCESGALKNAVGRLGNYLKCQNCGANNSWQGLSERIRRD
jgi:very-short-patch-repair endonuclease/transcription elongation GreA/GreB family factor